jgi:hypothetical protein
MLHPRLVLLVVGWSMALVGWQTAEYHPSYLALSPLWALLAFASAATCVAAAAHPHKSWVALSGSTLVCSAGGRSVGLLGQLGSGGVAAEQQPSFVVAAIVWALVAFLGYVVWSQYVLPWSIGGRRND